jgi:subtilase family serine protease
MDTRNLALLEVSIPRLRTFVFLLCIILVAATLTPMSSVAASTPTESTIIADSGDSNRIDHQLRSLSSPSASVQSFSVESGTFVAGESVTADVRVKNTGDSTHEFFVGFDVKGPNGEYYNNNGNTGTSVFLSPGEEQIISLSWTVEDGAPTGTYDGITVIWEESDSDNLNNDLDRATANGAFSVTETGAVEGYVKESDGNPISGAKVYLDSRTDTRTSSEGYYSFSEISPGDHDVYVTAGSCYDNPTRTVTVDGGETATEDFWLSSESYTVQVASEPISVSTSGSGTYDCGEDVEVSAPATSGDYEFSHWESRDGTVVSEQSTFTLSYLTNDHDLVAQYKQAGKPDLTITDVYWQPSSPSDGDEVTFYVDIENQGEARATSFRVEESLENDILRVDNIDLSPGDSKTIKMPSWDAVEGSYEITTEVDSESVVDEESESNNDYPTSISVKSSTRTLQGQVTDDEGSPIEGAKVYLDSRTDTRTNANGEYSFTDVSTGDHELYVTAGSCYDNPTRTVTVDASGTTENFQLSSESYTVQVASEPISVSTSGSGTYDCGEDVEVSAPATSGDYEFSHWESRDGTVVSEESTYSLSYLTNDHDLVAQYKQAGKPDLTITGISSSPSSPSNGDEVTFSVDVENQGDARAASFPVQLSIDDTILRTTNIDLGPRDSKTVELRSWDAVEGSYDASAEVDYDDTVSESDENNNKHSSIIDVSEASKYSVSLESAPVSVNLEGSGTYEENTDVTVSAPTEYDGHEFSHWEDSTGQQVSEDSNYAITGIERNHDLTARYTAPDQPDLIVDDLQIQPANPASSETIQARLTIRNVGTGTSVETQAELRQNGEVVGTSRIAELPAKTETTFLADLGELPAGEYNLEATADVYDESEEAEEGNNRYSETIVISEANESIQGIVHDPDGNVIQDATVTLDGGTTTTTDSAGAYSFDDVPVGDHRIKVSADGFEIANETFKIEDEGPSELDIELQPTSASEATVTGELTNGIDGVTISIAGETTETQSDGTFRHQATFEPGEYVVKYTHDGETYFEEVTLEAGQNTLVLEIPEEMGRRVALTELKDILVEGDLNETEKQQIEAVSKELTPDANGFVFGDLGQKYPDLIQDTDTAAYYGGWMTGVMTPGVDVITDSRDCAVWVEGGTVQTAADTLDCGGAVVNTAGTAAAWTGIGAGVATVEEITDLTSITAKAINKNPEKVSEIGAKLKKAAGKEKAKKVISRLDDFSSNTKKKLRRAVGKGHVSEETLARVSKNQLDGKLWEPLSKKDVRWALTNKNGAKADTLWLISTQKWYGVDVVNTPGYRHTVVRHFHPEHAVDVGVKPGSKAVAKGKSTATIWPKQLTPEEIRGLIETAARNGDPIGGGRIIHKVDPSKNNGIEKIVVTYDTDDGHIIAGFPKGGGVKNGDEVCKTYDC